MLKKIIEALKTKYANLGFSEKAFNGVAAYLEPSIKEEKDIETAIAGVESLLKVFQSETDQLRSAKTDAEKKFTDLKTQVDSLGGKPAEKKEPGKQEPMQIDKDTPAWAKALMESNQKLSDRFAALEGEKIASSRKQQLEGIVNKLPESLRKPYMRTAYKDLSEDDFKALTGDISKEVDQLVQDTKAKGAVFGRPSAGNDENSKGTLSQEQEKAIAHRDATPAKDAQPF